MMTTPIERHEFQTEARQLLDLMIHSVYSHKEIFLRELISNASDAIDKLRFEALTNPDYQRFTEDPHIRITADKAARTLSVEDNGIGMNHDEIIQYLGTIAKSGTREFAGALQQAREDGMRPELIGQFGVGFYSSFMVADKVTVVSRKPGEEMGVKWESTGDGTYTLEPAPRFEPGTTVTLHLKPSTEDEDYDDYLDEWRIRDIVRKYSDFVAYPIKMKVERTEIERDETGKPKEGAVERKEVRDETLNSMKAIWIRAESEVSDDEYNEFYKHISHDWTNPLKRIIMKAEGTSEFRALLFIPSKRPWDIFYRDADHGGIQLYVKRVFIMHDCKELIPEYLRFMRGVVDSEDLSLNISREILQQNRQIRLIRKSLTKKIFDTLRAMRKDEPENYRKFWNEFGRVLKEGLLQDSDNRDTLLDLSLFESTHGDEGAPTSLEDYIGRMKNGQDTIYYVTGPSLAVVKNSPHLEAFRDKGYEVLLLTDPIDELWVQGTFQYKEKRLQSVSKGEAELGTEEERKSAEEKRKEKENEVRDVLDEVRKALDDRIKEVRLSSRLTESPACLVGEAYDMTPQLEALMRATGQEPPKVKRILELNPSHPILDKLKELQSRDDGATQLSDYAELLYGQAVLAEGGQLPDPAAFSRRLATLMTRAL